MFDRRDVISICNFKNVNIIILLMLDLNDMSKNIL